MKTKMIKTYKIIHLEFQMNLRISFTTSLKRDVGILLGIALNLQITLGSTDVLTILSLAYEHKRSFDLSFL